MIDKLIKKKEISKYKLAKISGIPYMTINDICNKKTDLRKASAETIYKLSKALDVSMEELLEPYMAKRIDFELFKSNVCHILKEKGDIQFILEALKEEKIDYYFEKDWYKEAFYMLAMVDYLSRLNEVPLCTKYNKMRSMKLKETVYPASLIMYSYVKKDESILKSALKEAIPEFVRFNIVESEVRNVI